MNMGTSARGLFLIAMLGLALPVYSTSVPRIGLLTATACEGHRNYAALRQGLRELGYVEGQTLTVDCRGSPQRERLLDLAAELVRLKPDVLVSDGSAATRAAIGLRRRSRSSWGPWGTP